MPSLHGWSVLCKTLTSAVCLPASPPLRPVIPPFHAAVDRAISYLDREQGLLGVCDFFASSK